MSFREEELAREVAKLRRRLSRLESTASLAHSSIENGAITAFDETGTQTLQVGLQYDSTYTAASMAGPVPPTPVGPQVVGQPGFLNIVWNGGFEAGQVTPMDFARVEVYVSAAPITDPLPSLLVSTIETPQGATVTLGAGTGEYFVRLASRSLSGKVSALSAQATATVTAVPDSDTLEQVLITANGKNKNTFSTNVPSGEGTAVGDMWFRRDGNLVIAQWRWDGEDWLPQQIDGAVITNLDAGSITTGSLSGSRIEAGTITTDKLAAGSITADKIGFGTLSSNLILDASFPTQVGDSATNTQAHFWDVLYASGESTDLPGQTWAGRRAWIDNFSRTGGGGSLSLYHRPVDAVVRKGTGAAASASPIEVVPGDQYKASAWAYQHAGNNQRLQFRAIWYGPTFNPDDITIVDVSPTDNTITGGQTFNGWKQVSTPIFTVPPGAAFLRLSLRQQTPDDGSTHTMGIDDVLLVRIGAAAVEFTSVYLRMWDAQGSPTVDISAGGQQSFLKDIRSNGLAVQGPVQVGGAATPKFGFANPNVWYQAWSGDMIYDVSDPTDEAELVAYLRSLPTESHVWVRRAHRLKHYSWGAGWDPSTPANVQVWAVPRWKKLPLTAISGIGTSGVRVAEVDVTNPYPEVPILVTYSSFAHMIPSVAGTRPGLIAVIADSTGTTIGRFEDVATESATGSVARQATISALLPAGATSFKVQTTVLNRSGTGTIGIGGSANTDFGLLRVEPTHDDQW